MYLFSVLFFKQIILISTSFPSVVIGNDELSEIFGET